MIGLHHLIWIHLLKHSNHTLISKQVLAKHLLKHVAHTFLQTSSHFSLKNGRKKKIDPMSKTKATLLLCPWVLPGSVESVGIFFFPSIFCLVFVNEKYYHFRSGGKKERMPPFSNSIFHQKNWSDGRPSPNSSGVSLNFKFHIFIRDQLV